VSQKSHDRDREDLGFLRELIDAAKADPPEEARYLAARRKLLQELRADREENPIMSAIRRATYGKTRWGIAAAAAVLLIAAVVGLDLFGRTPGQAYAAVVEQLRKAQTVSFSAEWRFDENEPPTHLEMAFREPGIQRTVTELNGARIVQIYDTSQDEGIVLIPENKNYVRMDLASMPSVERERVQLIEFINRDMKTLPDRADEILEEKAIGERRVQGFRVGNRRIWIDVERESLVCVENQLGATRMVLTDFQIDPDNLDESKFTTTPPEGYVSVTDRAVLYDASNPGEADLVEYLRAAVTLIKDHRFPPTVNPMELMSLQKDGMLGEFESATPEEGQRAVESFIQTSQKAVMFVVTMKPENDWHYVGKGVTYGDSKTPIAWWRPGGSETYRVIWGDLSVSSLAPEDLSRVGKGGQ